jgi:integrase
MLNSLAAYWPGPLHLIRAHDLNAWLRGIKGGLIYRHHHYAAALQLIHFATGTNCVRAADFGDDFWKLVDDPEPPPVRIKIWTPEQLLKLLAKTLPNMIPFTALQAFAGVRHEELVPADFSSGTKAARTKIPLDWRDIYFGDGGQCGPHIEITEDTGKTGARIIPMSDNLVAWLTPHRKTSGPVCTVRNTANALTKAKRRAGLPAGKNESRNVLRKSFGSYRLAVVKHIGQVADEMGNSPAKIKSNYRKPRSESEGKRWFDIWPTTAEVLQLNFGGM